MTYIDGTYPPDLGYIPYTSLDIPGTHILYNGKPIYLALWNTAGQDDYDRLRPLSYPGTDVFILVFAVDSHSSFHRITDKRLPEIQTHNPMAPIVLVGSKNDLYSDQPTITKLHSCDLALTTKEEGEDLASAINAFSYMSYSSLTGMASRSYLIW